MSVNLGMDNTFEFSWIYGKDYKNATMRNETHNSIKCLISSDETIKNDDCRFIILFSMKTGFLMMITKIFQLKNCSQEYLTSKYSECNNMLSGNTTQREQGKKIRQCYEKVLIRLTFP